MLSPMAVPQVATLLGERTERMEGLERELQAQAQAATAMGDRVQDAEEALQRAQQEKAALEAEREQHETAHTAAVRDLNENVAKLRRNATVQSWSAAVGRQLAAKHEQEASDARRGSAAQLQSAAAQIAELEEDLKAIVLSPPCSCVALQSVL